MKAVTQRGNIAGVSTRDLSGSVMSRRAGLIDVGEVGAGYRVHSNRGRGPVDFGASEATLSTNARHWRRAGLSHPGDWRIVVRAFNEAGSEMNLDRCVEVKLDADGEREPGRPRGVTGLRGRAQRGGTVELSFSHDRPGEEAATTHFHIYHDGGTGVIDYETAAAEIIRAEGEVVHHVYVSETLGGERRHRFAVRSASTQDTEDEGMQYVEVTTDATAPEQPEGLSGGVIH